MSARFIPPYISEGASDSERKVFELLHDFEMDCVVFHSVGLPRHISKVYGEIDFVIVCRLGVLCLEVKGGAVECKDGVWKYIDRYGETHSDTEGPFKQAASGMFSLRGSVMAHPKVNCRLTGAQYACGVVFPDTVFNKKGTEFIPQIVYDYRTSDITEYIRRVFCYWKNTCGEKGIETLQLTDADISLLSNILRCDLLMLPDYRSVIDRIDGQIMKYTEDQVAFFNAISDNERLVVKGSAGTGKTVVGLEYAKRAADGGKHVLFLTFNKMLAEYLRHRSERAGLDVTHFHGYLGRHIEVTEEHQSEEYYESILPNSFLNYCEVSEIEKYDLVIVDEGQDLLRINYLLCIDAVLKGGLKNGKWCILLDPNQNIYNSEFGACFDLLQTYHFTSFKLITNCRNTKQIGSVNMAFHGNYVHPHYLKVDGESVLLSPYKSPDELKDKLRMTVKDLMKKGIDLSDVMLLLPVRYENSSIGKEEVFRSVCSFTKASELDFVTNLPHTLRYSTVHSYKGLESKVIILFDFNWTSEKHEMLSYIAISRAKTLLYIFYDAQYKEQLTKILQKSKTLSSVTFGA